MNFSQLLISGCLLLSCLGISPRTAQAQEQVTMGILQRPKAHFSGAVRTISADELQKAGSRSILTAIRNIDPGFVISENIGAGSDPNYLPAINLWGQMFLNEGGYDASQIQAHLPLFVLDGLEISLEQLDDMDVHRVERVTLLKNASATALYGVRASHGVVVITSKLPQRSGFHLTYKGGIHIETADLSSYDPMSAQEALQHDRAYGRYSGDNFAASPSYEAVAAAVANGLDTDWLNFPLRTGVGHRHHITAEGGGKALKYALSLNYNKTVGVMKDSDRERFGGTLLLDFTTEKFNLRNSFTISKVNRYHSPYGSFSEYTGLPSYLTPYDANGDLVEELWGDDNERWPVLYNPLFRTKLSEKNEGDYLLWQNNLSASWQLNPSLSLLARVGISKEKSVWERYISPQAPPYYHRYWRYFSDKPFTYDGDLVLSFSGLKNEYHQLLVEAGISAYKTKPKYREEVEIEGGFDDMIGGWPSDIDNCWRLGFFVAANYTYDRRYTVDFLIKWEKLSAFRASDDTHRPLGAVGIGWNLKNESFLVESAVISDFRLRASYGITGFQGFNSFQTQRMYGGSAVGFDVGEQKTYQGNVGVNLSFLNRYTLVADLYRKRTTNFPVSIFVPSPQLRPSYMGNIGDIRDVVHSGYEIGLNAELIKGEPSGWSWQAGARLNYSKNKMKKSKNRVVTRETDSSIGGIYVVPSKGIDPQTGKEVYVDKNGNETYEWNSADMVWVGSAYPPYRGNIHSALRCKGLTLTTYFGYYFGGVAYNETLVNSVAGSRYGKGILDRWNTSGGGEPSGGGNSTPRISSRFVEKDRFFNLQSLHLQYQFSTAWSREKLGMESLTLSGNAEDLFYHSSVKQERGTAYPFSRKFAISISATF